MTGTIPALSSLTYGEADWSTKHQQSVRNVATEVCTSGTEEKPQEESGKAPQRNLSLSGDSSDGWQFHQAELSGAQDLGSR